MAPRLFRKTQRVSEPYQVGLIAWEYVNERYASVWVHCCPVKKCFMPGMQGPILPSIDTDFPKGCRKRKRASHQSDPPITLMNLTQSCHTLAPCQHNVLLLFALSGFAHHSLCFRGQQTSVPVQLWVAPAEREFQLSLVPPSIGLTAEFRSYSLLRCCTTYVQRRLKLYPKTYISYLVGVKSARNRWH